MTSRSLTISKGPLFFQKLYYKNGHEPFSPLLLTEVLLSEHSPFKSFFSPSICFRVNFPTTPANNAMWIKDNNHDGPMYTLSCFVGIPSQRIFQAEIWTSYAVTLLSCIRPSGDCLTAVSGLSKNNGLGGPIRSLVQYVPFLYLCYVLHD